MLQCDEVIELGFPNNGSCSCTSSLLASSHLSSYTVWDCPDALPLVCDDVLLSRLLVLDLSTLVENVFSTLVHEDTKADILSQFDDVVENLAG